MCYLLLAVGFLSLGLGIFAVCYGPSGGRENGELLVLAGAIFFSGGAVSTDVVEELKRGNNRTE